MKYARSLALATACVTAGVAIGSLTNISALAQMGGWNVKQACYQATHASVSNAQWQKNLQLTYAHFTDVWGNFHTTVQATHKVSPMKIDAMAHAVAQYFCQH